MTRPPGAPTPDSWHVHAARMADELRESGACTDERWLAAFRAMPRDRFLTTIYQPRAGTWSRSSVVDTTDRAAWLARCYDPAAAAVTAIAESDPFTAATPIAVSPAPATIAALLHALDIDPHQRHRHPSTLKVLDVGTGSGYTAALLAHQASNLVTAVDIDPDLTDAASRAFAALGVPVDTAVGDSSVDLPEGMWDRILVGHSIDRVPPAWLRHVQPDGIVVADLTGSLGSHGLIQLRRVDQPDVPRVRRDRPRTVAESAALAQAQQVTLQGRFLPTPIEALAPPRRSAALARRHLTSATGDLREGTLPHSPREVLRDPLLRFLYQLYLPLGTTLCSSVAGSRSTRFSAPDGSWTAISHVRGLAGEVDYTSGGATDLASAIEATHIAYRELGAPTLDQFDVTVSHTGTVITHPRDPDRYRWSLASTTGQTFGASA